MYFLGKLISAENNFVQTDRLGSVRSGGPGWLGYQAQYPYGVEYAPQSVNDREKYATYTRDSVTGLDYAMNRYYSSQWGRFLSPDPYTNSAGLRDPGSWNRYLYTRSDPVNRLDPGGLWDRNADGGGEAGDGGTPPGGGEPGGGGGGCILGAMYCPVPVGSGDGGATNRQVIAAAEKLAEKWLQNKQCSQLFGNGFNPETVLQSLATSGTFSAGYSEITLSFAPWTGAVADAFTRPFLNPAAAADLGQYGILLGLSASITINTSALPSLSASPDGPVEETAEAIVEELGHAYSYIPVSGDSQIIPDGLLAPLQSGMSMSSAQAYNYGLIMKNCSQ